MRQVIAPVVGRRRVTLSYICSAQTKMKRRFLGRTRSPQGLCEHLINALKLGVPRGFCCRSRAELKGPSAHLIKKVSRHITPVNRAQRQWIAATRTLEALRSSFLSGSRAIEATFLPWTFSGTAPLLELLFSCPHLAMSALVEGTARPFQTATSVFRHF